MFFSYAKVSTALVAITCLSQASLSVAGHARGVGHLRRALHAGHGRIDVHAKRANAGNVELPLGQLQMLQSEYTTFKTWMTTGFNDSASIDPADYLAQVKQEFTAYDGWMTAWLDSALNAGSPSAPPTPSTSPLLPLPSARASNPTPPAPTTSPLLPLPSAGASNASFSGSSSVVGATSSSASASPLGLQQKARKSQSQAAPSNSQSAGPASSSAAAPASASAGSLISASAAPSAVPSSGSSSSSGSFNAAGSSNVAVYYGQTGATGQVKLSDLCADQGTNIVLLAFLTTYFGPGGYPTLNFGSACGSAGAAAAAKGATGLLSCPDLAKEIQTCQSAGKKVLLSLGGSEAVTAFSSDSQASTFATQINNLFTGGTGESADLRPFGSIKLDGFDIDNEDHSTAHYSAFVSALRTAMNADSSKPYYISAAPQCPRPDESIPLDAMQTMDFVWVQFYNNGPCNVGQPGFLDSFKSWSSDLSAKGKGPKLYIGAPACSACAGSGYQAPAAMASVIKSVQGAAVPNFGGVMLWDGAEAVVNGNYQQGVKSALG